MDPTLEVSWHNKRLIWRYLILDRLSEAQLVARRGLSLAWDVKLLDCVIGAGPTSPMQPCSTRIESGIKSVGGVAVVELVVLSPDRPHRGHHGVIVVGNLEKLYSFQCALK